jgi:hypothetical protein
MNLIFYQGNSHPGQKKNVHRRRAGLRFVDTLVKRKCFWKQFSVIHICKRTLPVIKLSPLSFKIFKKYKHFFIVCHQPKFDCTIPCQKYQQNRHVDWQRATLRIRLAKSHAVYAPDMNTHGF